MSHVLDASALLAFLQGEPGNSRVREVLKGRPAIASINLGEVAHRMTLTGESRDAIVAALDDFKLVVHPVDRDLAIEAGLAAELAKPFGLSFADRICLMLAKRLDLPVLTSDRRMAESADALDVRVELIR